MAKRRTGFALLPPAVRRRLGSKGGKAVPAAKRAFTRDRKLALRAAALGAVANLRKWGYLG